MKSFLLLSLIVPAGLLAQPATDIWLFDLSEKGGLLAASNGRNITARKGYDNQPFFHPGKSVLYYTSAQDDGRTDIKQYDLKEKQFSLLIQTMEREYSPTVTPDGKFISCIIQRDNGVQDLGRYPIDGGPPEVLISNLTVGYHAWIDMHRVAVFALGEVMTLHVVDLEARSDTLLAGNIGRSLHRIPGHTAVSYVQKGDQEWMIRRIHGKDLIIDDVAPALKEREDLAWLPNGNLLMSDGTKLFEWSRKAGWREVILTAPQALAGITRLAVDASGKYLAVVANE